MRPVRSAVAAVVALIAALLLASCGSDAPEPGASESPADRPSGTLEVAAYNFGESQIVGNLYVGALNAAGIPATVRTLTNREIVLPAIQKGEIQIVGDYVGTLTEFLNLEINGKDAPPMSSPDLDSTMTNLRSLTAEEDLVVLNPAPATDQNAFAVTEEFAKEHDLETLSDLGIYSQQHPVVVGGPPECPQRPFCLVGLKDLYDVKVKEFVSLDAGGPLTKAALQQGKIEVGLVLTSDGALEQFDLVILEDDKGLQPAENIVPLLNQKASDPDVNGVLNRLSAKLTTEELQEMNYSVDWERKDPAEVADSWLAANGLA